MGASTGRAGLRGCGRGDGGCGGSGRRAEGGGRPGVARQRERRIGPRADPVVQDLVLPGGWEERDEPLDEFQGGEVECGGAVGPGGLQVEDESAVVLFLEACAAQGGPGNVAAEAFEARTVEEDARPACRRSRVAAFVLTSRLAPQHKTAADSGMQVARDSGL